MEKLSDTHSKLYHYTNEQGLLGILKEQCLWATHCKFLNDNSEIELAREKIRKDLYPSTLEFFKKIINEYPKAQDFVSAKGGLKRMVTYSNDLIVDFKYQEFAESNEIYITSFCAENEDNYINENGLLSQWRAYGGDGGFAIVFKKQGLKDLLKVEDEVFIYNGLIFKDVVYSGDENQYEREFAKCIETISAYRNESLRNIILETNQFPEDELTRNSYECFFDIVTRYKHCGFKEEREVRIATLHFASEIKNQNIMDEASKNMKEKERKFRNINGRLIPYIELFRSKDTILPIEKIIVGPHKDKALRAAALRIMLRNTGIAVTVSEIPYSS